MRVFQQNKISLVSRIFLEVSRNFDSRKTKYILFLYAYVYDDFKQVIDSGSLEVEHILPKQWQNANFNEWDEQSHFEYLENIGNKNFTT